MDGSAIVLTFITQRNIETHRPETLFLQCNGIYSGPLALTLVGMCRASTFRGLSHSLELCTIRDYACSCRTHTATMDTVRLHSRTRSGMGSRKSMTQPTAKSLANPSSNTPPPPKKREEKQSSTNFDRALVAIKVVRCKKRKWFQNNLSIQL